MKILTDKQYDKVLKHAFEQGLLSRTMLTYDPNEFWEKYVNDAWYFMKEVVKNIR